MQITNQQINTWLLPEGIEEILPDEARYLEDLRGRLLAVFSSWGYELVIPPMIDFIDSLLTGAGHDLDLQTFKLTDQISGEMLGLRADMTPQVARIDAHHLQHDWPTRLCYAGTVLHTRGDPLEKTRSPMQIGAELYGHDGRESDLEVICLMLEMLAITGLQQVHLDLGHVGIYRSLSQQAGLTEGQESQLFSVLQRKAKPELTALLADFGMSAELNAMFAKLPELNGDRTTLEDASRVLAKAGAEVNVALADLATVADKLAARFPHLAISFDLAELRGYHYHTGIVFAAFVPSVGREIARGGRYDNIGAVFGRARPATGFSADLKVLSALSKQAMPPEPVQRIFAPYLDDAKLQQKIRDLRAQQQCVIEQLPGQQGTAADLGCTAVLEQDQHNWVVKPLA